MVKRNMVCIVCPLGCRMEVETGDELKVTGNTCKRGYAYAVKECTNPTRTLTTTVGVSCGELLVVPVKTDGEIPKDKIMECMKLIRKVRVEAPVRTGDILRKDILGTGVNLIAVRDIEKKLEQT